MVSLVTVTWDPSQRGSQPRWQSDLSIFVQPPKAPLHQPWGTWDLRLTQLSPFSLVSRFVRGNQGVLIAPVIAFLPLHAWSPEFNPQHCKDKEKESAYRQAWEHIPTPTLRRLRREDHELQAWTTQWGRVTTALNTCSHLAGVSHSSKNYVDRYKFFFFH